MTDRYPTLHPTRATRPVHELTTTTLSDKIEADFNADIAAGGTGWIEVPRPDGISRIEAGDGVVLTPGDFGHFIGEVADYDDNTRIIYVELS